MNEDTEFVRYQATEPNARGASIGIFGLANALAAEGKLNQEDYEWWTNANAGYQDAYPDPARIDPTVYDRKINPHAQAWFTASADHLMYSSAAITEPAATCRGPTVARQGLMVEQWRMTISDHDTYIAAAPEQFRPLLAALRAQLARTLPDAEEVIEYNMPGFRIGRSIVASYAAFSKLCGLYLAPGAITAHAEDIAAAGLKATKTGITFPVNNPIPDNLVKQLALTSRQDVGR